MGINPRPFIIFFAFIGIFLILNPHLLFALLPHNSDAYNNVTEQLKKNKNISENLLKHPEIIDALEKGNESAFIVEKPVYITVTPTPDGKLYFANEYESGIRKIKRPFSWIRENVSGYKDLSVHVTVYNYKTLNSFTWFNPSDYKYYKEYPSDLSMKFAFIFIQIYMDDIIGNDPRMWLPDEKHYALQISNRLYYPIENFTKQIRIKEFEDTYTFNDDYRVGYYGTLKYYSSGHRETAGETYDELTYLRGGKSNAVDGYLIYEIPKDTKDEDLILTASFNQFGNSAWVLEPQRIAGEYYAYDT